MTSLLKNKNYMKLFIANTISRFGDSIDMIAFGFMVYQLTGSKMLLATVYIFNVLPNILFSSFAGTIVDYFSKKRLIIVGDYLRAAITGLTALLFMTNLLVPWHLLLLTFINSTIETLVSPAKFSTIPKLVDKEDLHIVNSTMQSITQFVELIGLAIAGIIIASLGIETAIIIDAITFIGSAIIISRIDFPKEENQQLTRSNYIESYKEGFQFLLNKKVFLYLIISIALLNFFVTPINALGPAYVSDVLEMGPEGLGYMSIAQVIGMIIGGLIVGKLGPSIKLSTITLIGLFISGIFYTALAIPAFILKPSNIIVALTSLFLIGLFLPFANTGLQTFIMTYCEESMLSRLGALMKMFGMSANPLGALISGIIVSYLPLQYLFIIFGILFVASSFLPSSAMNNYIKQHTDDTSPTPSKDNLTAA